ncbi:glycerate kinase [Thermovenabulum sp.]|uniref:glycerate kinase n=1 Tax=Thermovenabulum sp. TaxID=3100335 RepID=UPI003C7B43B5
MRKVNILIAPDSFKGSLTSLQAANAIERGIVKAASYVGVNLEVAKVPIADGGEGTVEAIIYATGGKLIRTKVLDPLGGETDSFFGLLPDGTAVIEMAAASGLNFLKPEERNPMETTTYGTGQLIKAALDYGIKKLIIGIGGSATNDGGVGMAQALGIKFLDAEGKEIGFGGERSPLAMSIIGYITSIPVFCDSGYVILTPLNKALAKRANIPIAVMAVTLSTGLYATHTLVPPTPGPIAAAGNVRADLGLVILIGMVVSIPAALIGLWWAHRIGKDIKSEIDQDGMSYEELKDKIWFL